MGGLNSVIKFLIALILIVVLGILIILGKWVYFNYSGESSADDSIYVIHIPNSSCYSFPDGSIICDDNSTPPEPTPEPGPKPIPNRTEPVILEVNEEVITLMMYAIGADKLHEPPYSDETPKIEVIVGTNYFYSVVVDNEIFTSEGESEDEDIQIFMTTETAIEILSAGNVKEGLTDAINAGLIGVHPVAAEYELFSKGYMELYEDFGMQEPIEGAQPSLVDSGDGDSTPTVGDTPMQFVQLKFADGNDATRLNGTWENNTWIVLVIAVIVLVFLLWLLRFLKKR